MRYFVSLILLLCSSLLQAQDCFTLHGSTAETRDNLHFKENGTFKPFRRAVSLTGLAISGTITKSSPDYLVRIVMTDTKGNEFLVMESYEEINDNASFSVSNYCEETAELPPFTPENVKIYLKDASVTISAIHTVQSGKVQDLSKLREERKKKQVDCIIDRINAYNKKNRRLWVADKTTFSQMDYATRKQVLGLSDDQLTFGYEYYAGGIFEVGHGTQPRRSGNSPYVETVDWRNRFGRNWMTPVKSQSTSRYCVAFAALGAAEALANIYYNQDLNLNLSEQELASCSGSSPYRFNEPIPTDTAFNYLQNHGVCDEESFPFDSIHTYQIIPCRSDSIIPIYTFKIDSSQFVERTENSLKHALIFKGPLFSGYMKDTAKNEGHAVLLVGYNTFHAGDTVYRYVVQGNGEYKKLITVLTPEDSTYIGRSYWIYKNSYANSQNSYHNGYDYFLFYDRYYSYMNTTRTLEPPFTLSPEPELGRIWEDKDGDGMFFWGIGPKPNSCPAWVPDEMDGDDEDPTRGCFDQYGYATLYDGHNHSSPIDNSTTYSNDTIISCNLDVNSCELTVNGYMNVIGSAVIRLNGYGDLIVDGGCIYNAEIEMSNRARIFLRNGGKILMRKGKSLDVPVGAELVIEEGEITQNVGQL